MSGEPFFDTNVIFYCFSDDRVRAPIARRCLEERGVVSVQVLNELCLALRRTGGLDWRAIDAVMEAVEPFLTTIRPTTIQTHVLGREIAERYKLQFYDSLLLAAALETGCRRFISEDMQHGLIVDGLTVENPFRA